MTALAAMDTEFTPATASELARVLAENAVGARTPLSAVGGRTALGYGGTVAAESRTIPLSRLNRVIDYPARDMTITIEAGATIDQLKSVLQQERQQLPIDIPQSNRATLGGILACNVSGCRRYGYGTLRDYVIGISAVDGAGRHFSAGGRVVKNVAGYDLCKLLIGSLGTLAVITQVTLKLKPLPERTGLLWATYDTLLEIDDVLSRLCRSDARPVSIDVLNATAARELANECRRELPADRPVLLVGVEGSEKEVAWQLSALTRELAPLGPDELFALEDSESQIVREALTDYPTESDAPISLQASLLPSRTIAFLERCSQSGMGWMAHAGNGIVHAHFPDEAATPERAAELLAPLRDLALAGSGSIRLTRRPDAWASRFPGILGTPAAWGLMRQVKSALDPHNLLNRGKLFAEAETLATAQGAK